MKLMMCSYDTLKRQNLANRNNIAVCVDKGLTKSFKGKCDTEMFYYHSQRNRGPQRQFSGKYLFGRRFEN